jgi:hypothetical protein
MTPISEMLPDRLRSFVDVNWFSYWYLYKSNGMLSIISIGFFFSGLFGALASLGELQAAFLTAVGACLIGLLGILKDAISFKDFVFSVEKVRLEPDPKVASIIRRLAVGEGERSRGFELLTVPGTSSSGIGERVIRSQSFDAFLRRADVPVSVDEHAADSMRELLTSNAGIYDAALREQYRRSSGQRFFNEQKVSLVSDLDAGMEALRISQSTYFESFLTNELVTKTVETRDQRPQVLYYGSKCFPVVEIKGVPIMKSVSDSCMNNHIGISTLVVTADNCLVLWRQSDSAQHSQLLLAPTGSGSCDWSDWIGLAAGQRTLHGLLLRAMEREFKEESSLSKSLRTVALQTFPLGFFRWVRRGGKPEFVGVSTVSASAHQLVPNIVEVDRPVDLINYPAASRKQLLASIGDRLAQGHLSVPLWVNLVCLKEALEDPQFPAERIFNWD